MVGHKLCDGLQKYVNKGRGMGGKSNFLVLEDLEGGQKVILGLVKVKSSAKSLTEPLEHIRIFAREFFPLQKQTFDLLAVGTTA